MAQGFFMLARKAFDATTGDPLWREARTFSRYEAWLDLVQMAAWRRSTYQTPTRIDRLERGEFVASLRYLAQRWRWPKSSVDRFLKWLEKDGRIRARVGQTVPPLSDDAATTSKSDAAESGTDAGQPTGRTVGQHGSVYLVVNYDTYQRPATAGGTPRGTPRGTVDGGETPEKRDKVEEGKKEKKRTTTAAGASADKKPSGGRYPHFSRGDCDALFEQWITTHGAVDYGRFRKAIGPAYQIPDALPSLDAMREAMVAHQEAVAEMDDREAGFETVERFASRIDHWLRLGALPYSTPEGVLTERGRVLGSKALREQARTLRAVA